MEQQYDYEEIRCYEDRDVQPILSKLLADPSVLAVIKQVMPDVDTDALIEKMRRMTTIKEFQLGVIAPFVMSLVQKTCTAFELHNNETIDHENGSLYITNHRDIVLDSAFLDVMLHYQAKAETVEIAIGDNLLIYPWIRDLVRLNKSFIVMRDVPVRQMLEVSKRLSSYIHYTIQEKKNSIWIAQREGRSKDSSDQTQASVIKMLSLGGPTRSIVENLKYLNIRPVALSYEYDPCDYLKAMEFQLKRDIEGWKKSKADDLHSMATGIMGYKGRVIFTVADPLNVALSTYPAEMDKNAQANAICLEIDKAIHSHMHLYEINYVAYDLRFDTDKYADRYTEEQKKQALIYLNGQLAKIEIDNKDEAFLWEKLLEMYSNPVVNYEKAHN